MEPMMAEQSISQVRLTFPKRIFEVCHLMQRETEVEFFAEGAAGEFNNHIHLSKPDEEHVCVSLTADNLTFAANDLCFFVDQVIAKDPVAVAEILAELQHKNLCKSRCEDDPADSLQEQEAIENGFRSSSLAETHSTYDGIKVKKKRGRPRKAEVVGNSNDTITVNQTETDTENQLSHFSDEEDDDKFSPEEKCPKDNYDSMTTPSGRRIRKPARFRPDLNESDSGASEGDGTDKNDPDGVLVFHSAHELSKCSLATESVSDVHVVVEKRKRGRPCKPTSKTQEEKANKKPHAGRGKKRPNYKREANIECKICHNMYKDELSLIAHVQKLHAKDPCIPQYIAELKELAKVVCKLCGKVLGNKRNEMASHMMRVHGKDDDFISKCDECGMEFRRSFLLKEHIRRQHPKHDRVLCHLCPASFKLKEYLTEHIKYTHNKQFKWQCDICHKMTSSPKNLRRHKRLHDGLTYQCPICQKMFSEAGNMKRHILYVHNAQEVSRRSCPHCDRDFTTKNNLIQHINLVHLKTTSFYCDICKKYFLRKKQLIEHAATVHPGVPILSTKLDDDVGLTNQDEDTSLSASITQNQDHQQTFTALTDVEGNAGRATIILQGPDGSEHVLVTTHQGLNGEDTSVAELQQQMVDMGAGEDIHNAVHNIDMLSGEGTTVQAATVTEGSLSLVAQQALAAFEAGGGLDASEFGAEQYLTVIGEDGQEIRVQIVRKEPSDIHQEQELENIYAQAAGVGLELSDHVQDEEVAQGQNMEVTASQGMEGTTVTILQAGEEINEETSNPVDVQEGTTSRYINATDLQEGAREGFIDNKEVGTLVGNENTETGAVEGDASADSTSADSTSADCTNVVISGGQLDTSET